MKRTKSLFVALLVMVMCAVSLGFAQPAYAANENVLTVNVTDDYYGNPVAGATLKATPATERLPGYPYPACPPVTPVIPAPDPATLPGSDTPRAMTQTPGAPGVPYTQTGHVDRDADNNYLLTTGSDGTVVIPDYLVERESTITQLTTPDGYTIEDPNPQTAKITGTDTTAEVVFVNKKNEVLTPEPASEPSFEPTPALEPQPQPQPQPQPEAPKAKKVKKGAFPDTGDNALTLPLIIGVAGVTVVVAGAALFLHKKRQ